MRARAASARAVLARHPWTLGLIGSRRTPGPDLLRHHERVLGCLRHNGFSVRLATHAFSAIDAYGCGLVLTELNLPFSADEGVEVFVDEIQQHLPAEEYPNLVELLTERVIGQHYDHGEEFEVGLDLILDSLERRLASDPG